MFPEAGINLQGHKIAQKILSAVCHDGRVFAVGSTLRFFAFDAETGKPLWQTPLGKKHAEMEAAKVVALKAGKFPGGSYGNRSWGFSPIAAAGMIICNNKRGGLVAFDPATGVRRWKVENVAADDAMPVILHHEGKPRAIAC